MKVYYNQKYVLGSTRTEEQVEGLVKFAIEAPHNKRQVDQFVEYYILKYMGTNGYMGREYFYLGNYYFTLE